MYLRKMGSVSLLTREGEVEIAKRIEDGERRVLKVVLNSPVAIEEILDLGDKLRKGKIRVKEVVKDTDEDDEEFDEAFHVERVCKIIDKVRRVAKDLEKVEEKKNKRSLSESTKRKAKNQADALREDLLDALHDLRLNKKQIDRIVMRLKGLVSRIESARREIVENEQRTGGMSERGDPQEPARGARLGLAAAQEAPRLAQARAAGRGPREQPGGHRRSAQAHEEGRGRGRAARAPVCARRYATSRTASGRPSRPRPSWSRPTCASSCPSPRSTPTAACSSWT